MLIRHLIDMRFQILDWKLDYNLLAGYFWLTKLSMETKLKIGLYWS